MERLIYEFDCRVEVTILTWKWLQIRSVPQFLYICQFLDTPSISTCTSVFCWILSRWQWPPWLGLSITFSIKNPVSGNPGYGNDNLGGWTCPLLKPSQQRILDALLWIVFEVFLSTRVNTFFKKKEEEKQRQVELSTFFLSFCPLCESEGENVPHPSFSSLPGRYILLGEQWGMWIYVGPGSSWEVPECSSLFGGQSRVWNPGSWGLGTPGRGWWWDRE